MDHACGLGCPNTPMSGIAKVDQNFQKFADKHDHPVEVDRRMSVIFDDLLSNVIYYGFPDDEAHEIDIRAEPVGFAYGDR